MRPRHFLCIHGHFYQPPRENPWTQEIELQKSAAPFHDWNERIHVESYMPNARARIFDAEGRITHITNNFENMSFNFGPTLMSWLEAKHPDTYRDIILADQLSLAAHNGHGNAIAQGYSHMIMPLANRRDKVTQVRWGLEDFRRRFGRESESIWLPETAVNEETLEVLVEEGMKFIILEPNQAEAVRPFDPAQGKPIDGKDWKDVSSGAIDPKGPYRCFLKRFPEKTIDIFFYDGPVSKAIGFEDVLLNATRLMDRIETARDGSRHDDQLVCTATDGETFGHHKAFGDRVLAYLMNAEAPQREWKIVNFGEYLESHPPRHAVRLKPGEHGEGTSWSCPHGVKRWKEHCGCRGGGPGHWGQTWRKPLREALDWLRDELAAIFESRGGEFMRNPWEARDAYIRIVLDRSEENVERFFAVEAKRALSAEERTLALKLLEMQRHAMLMYTSCGWFFTDLSGIETVQILQYAARAVQLGQEVSGAALEAEFLKRLGEAKSNVAELRDGRAVYEKFVRPSMTPPLKVAAHYAILSLFYGHKERLPMYCYRLEALHQREESYANITMSSGRVKVLSDITREESDLLFIVVQLGNFDFRCSVKPAAEVEDFERIEKELFDNLFSTHVVDLLRKIDLYFGKEYFDLKDLFLAERQNILNILSKEAIEKVGLMYEQLYHDSRRMNEIYSSINLPIPEEIRYAATLTLSKRLRSEIYDLAGQGFDLKKAPSLLPIIDIARKFDVDLKKQDISGFLSEELSKRTARLLDQVKPKPVEEALHIEKLARTVGIELDKRAAQDDVFALLKRWREHPDSVSLLPSGLADDIFRLASAIDINPKEYKRKPAVQV